MVDFCHLRSGSLSYWLNTFIYIGRVPFLGLRLVNHYLSGGLLGAGVPDFIVIIRKIGTYRFGRWLVKTILFTYLIGMGYIRVT